MPVRCSRHDFHLSTTSECVQIAGKEDFRELFLKPFFFGCEADDPVTASAFDTLRNPLSARINAIYGSDIGHFDVPDMSDVTAEAYEPVEHGAMTEEDFRDFVFSNPVKLWTALNPHFFKGTVVESAVSRSLANSGTAPRGTKP